MKQYDNDPCTCEGRADIDPAVSSHYQTCFLPTGWRLDYDTLVTEDKPRTLLIEGKCSDCGKPMYYPIPLAANFTGGTLLEHIYERMENARPLANLGPDGSYSCYCSERSNWYEVQDGMHRAQRNQQFFRLFRSEDRAFVRQWLYQNKPVCEPDFILRENGAEFFLATIRSAQKDGELEKYAPHVQWVLKGETPEEADLCCGRFDFLSVVEITESSACITCFLKGKFDDSGRNRLELGTFCSTNKGRESTDAIGELAAVLGRHATRHIKRNRFRYLSQEELAKEHERPALLDVIDPAATHEAEDLPF